MKKNISINISGIIFHIEEDGYDKLKNYLDSINRYFSTFDDSHEIIADIEGRIAEIFLTKLKDGKQVISEEDVNSLISTMGSVKDFQAAEEETSYISTEEEETKMDEEDNEFHPPVSEPKRLYRDGKRKILGGVLAGIAHYFSVDPLWIRLVYLLFFFLISYQKPIAGVLVLAYIVMWVATPISYELEEEEKLRKMFRDKDSKVLGGVCSGIAAYFGVDVVVIRLLFFITIFFAGTGVLLYIILWIILPEAKTITDKMKMKGQPVTLSNIESNIKKSFHVEEGEENIFVKILLFPFRVLSIVFDFLSKAIGPLLKFLVEAVRILVGIILTLTGVGSFAVTVLVLGTLSGVLNYAEFLPHDNIPIFLISNEISWWLGLGLFFLLTIPFIFLSILGLMVITKKNLLSAKIGWSLLGLWLLSVAVVGINIPKKYLAFSQEASFVTTDTWNIPDKTLVLDVRNDIDIEFNQPDLDIKQSQDSLIKLEKTFESKGRNREDALENANMVEFSLQQNDSVFTFDKNMKFKENAKFREQKIDMVLFIPEGQEFVIDSELNHLLNGFFRRHGFSYYDIDKYTWYFEGGDLKCKECVKEEEKAEEKQEEVQNIISGEERNYDLGTFKEVEIDGNFIVEIVEGSSHQVSLKGEDADIEKLRVEKNGNNLTIRTKNNVESEQTSVKVIINMTEIDRLDIQGTNRVLLNDFDLDRLNLRMYGASQCEINSNIDNLEINTEGSSRVNVFGKGDRLTIDASNASQVNAFDFYADNAEVKASGAAEVRVNASDLLKIRAEDGSQIKYRGDGRIEIEKRDRASVEKD